MNEPKLTLERVEWGVKRGAPYEGVMQDSLMTASEARRISERMTAQHGTSWPVVWRARYVSPWAEGKAPSTTEGVPAGPPLHEATDRDGGTIPSGEQCLGFCGQGRDPGAYPSGCTEGDE